MNEKNRFCQLYTPEGEALLKKEAEFVPWNTYPRPHLRRDSFFA